MSGLNLIVSLGVGIFLGLGIGLFEWPESVLTDYELGITLIAIVASFFTSWLLLKWLDRQPPDDSYTSPPEPPTFGGGS